MKNIFTILSLVLITAATQGQTLISNHFAAPGDEYKYFYTDTLAIVPGPAGIAQEWNFEDLNVDTVLQIDSYLPPIVTNPPITGSTTVTGDSLNGFTFFKNTATEYTMLGFTDSANVNVVPYSNPMTMLTFPFSYGNTNTDNYAFTASFQGNNVNVTGTITTLADGSGNLLLPQGVFNNVLRVKYTVVSNATVLFFNVTQTQNIYEWYDGNYKFPLLHIETTVTSDPFGGAPTTDKIVWIKATGPASIKSLDGRSNFNLAPNPAQDMVNVIFDNKNANPTKIIIANAIGQIVYESNHLDTKLSNLNISTSELDKGIYFVTMIQNNSSFTKILVVQ
jgi:hypothetical protein